MNFINRLLSYLFLFLLSLQLFCACSNLSSQILNEEERGQSHTPAARLASGVKLGVQAWNDFKNLTQAQSTLMFLAERYGNVGIEFGRSKYTHDYTTTQSPLFNVGVADFGDMTEVRLLDGTVLLAKDQVILPKNLILGKATDSSEERFKSTSTRLGINVFTEMPSVSYNQNKSQSTQQTHRNAVVHIYGPGGVLDATQSQSLTLDGGRIIAPRAQGRVDQVTVTSHQDQATSSQSGFGFGISGTLATGPRGSVNVARGRSYEQSVHDEAGLQIQDPTGFSIGNLTVTGPTLDKNLATLADHVTFHPLKDDKASWSFQGSLCNLDLSSPEKFFHSLKSSVTQAVKVALAAELTHQAGGTGLLPSAAGILAGLDLTNDGTTQDINITGGFSFNDGKRQFDVPFVNFNSKKPIPSVPQQVDEKDDKQEDTQPKTQPSAIPHDTENEPYDSADEDDSQYDDIFKSPASQDHERDNVDPFRAYFYDNLRQGPTPQPQSIYSLLANMDQASAPEDDQNSEYFDAFNRTINAPPVPRTTFDDAMTARLYDAITHPSQQESTSTSPRLERTPLQNILQQVSQKIPPKIKKGLRKVGDILGQTIEEDKKYAPQIVTDVAESLLNGLDHLSQQGATQTRRRLREVGISPGLAQDIGDVARLGLNLLGPGVSAKGIKGAANATKEANAITKAVRVGEETNLGLNARQLTGPRLVEINRQKGRTFQETVQDHLRMQENQQLYTVNVPGHGLISTRPDLPISLAGITDIKNVQKVSFTQQLQAQAALAKEQGISFNLIISPNTETISKKLYDAIIDRKGKIFEYNPTTQQMTERIVQVNRVVR